MKFTLDSQELNKAMAIARTVVGKPRYPSMNFAQLKYDGVSMRLRSTDMIMVMWINISGSADQIGELSLPIKLIEQFTKKQRGPITIENTGEKHIIISGNNDGGYAKLTVESLDKSDVTPIPEFSKEYYTANLTPAIVQSLKMALICAAEEESRPVLTGVLVDTETTPETISIASADGFRLFTRDLKIEAEGFRAVVPGKVIDILTRYVKDTNVSFKVNHSKSNAMFISDNITIFTTLIEGVFPLYLQLIPKDNPIWTFECSAPLLSQRLSQYVDKTGSGIVRFTQCNDEPAMNISMGMKEKDGFTEYYESRFHATITGDKDGKIAANQKYVSELIAPFSSVKFAMTNSQSPIVITGDLENVKIVLMPMFVQW